MYSSYNAVREAIANKQTSCVDLVTYYLQQIENKKHLNVFLEVYAEEALQRASEVDARIAAGTAGKLAGMVVGVKDVICYQDHGLQAASKILTGFQSQFTATALEKMLAEDAIIIGRQNCDEFAMGSSNENSAFGPTLNNIDETRVPGGSSGASAVAVSADLCLISLGSDTGGSVRQPAAFCGVVGLKPTYSRISRYGLIAYASSFDTIGIIGKNVPDVALMLEVIAGEDGYDATVSRREVPAYSHLLKAEQSYKIGYIKETIESPGIDPEIKKQTLEAIEWLKGQGHEVEEVTFPLLDYVLPTYYILTTAEASTNLSRFDGVRYGYRSPNAQNLEQMYKKSRSEGFGNEVKKRIMLGTFVLSASYYDAYFTKAQKVRRLIKEATEKLLSNHDFLIMPTTPRPAFKIGEFSEADPVAIYLEDLYTVQASVAGLPAISVPNGETASGLPIGLQVISNSFTEEKLLAFSQHFSQKTAVEA